VRRIAHIELVLAERNNNGQGVASVVGEQSGSPKRAVRAKRKGPARKKKTAKA